MPAETAHQWLRRTTATAHAETERHFEAFDLATRRGLGGFLQAHAAVVWPLERELDRLGVAHLLSDWAQRRRGATLRDDLQHLELSTQDEEADTFPVPLQTDAHRLGALYVIEGSRLGGTLLKRLVEASPDPAVRARVSYLGHSPGPRAWRGFLDVLDRQALSAAAAQAMKEAALAVFSGFAQSADRVLRQMRPSG